MKDNTILQIIRSVLGQEIGEEEELWESGKMDSMQLVEIIVALEKKTGKSVPPSHVTKENFSSLERMRSYFAL